VPRKATYGGRGHNGGPPLDDEPHVPEWGRRGIGNYFSWRSAHRTAWRAKSAETMLRRLEKAESLGLTYEEYTLEILEHGRYLQAEDTERVVAIKMRRRSRRRAQERGGSSDAGQQKTVDSAV
jgi:hypothetical protein